MNVFVLIGSIPYEDSYVMGIYSTREKAEAGMRRAKQKDSDMNYSIDCWEIDKYD